MRPAVDERLSLALKRSGSECAIIRVPPAVSGCAVGVVIFGLAEAVREH
jgi:hypothetical protein